VNNSVDPLARQLVALKAREGWTWPDVAKKLGVHVISVTRWGTGTRRPLGLPRVALVRLLKRHGVEPSQGKART
jgi:DNA-binding transcriptional regulator YiaG